MTYIGKDVARTGDQYRIVLAYKTGESTVDPFKNWLPWDFDLKESVHNPTTLEDLDEKSLVKILLEPKNSLIKQYQRLFEFENVELEFQDDAISEVARKAISKKTGARGLRSILENILLKTMFELPDMENVIKVTVDSAAVRGVTEPIVTYGKKTSTSVA